MSEAHDVGPLGEEAAKLLGALSGWARECAAEVSDGLSGFADRAASAVHGIDEQHLAAGAAECTVCSLCRAAHTLHQVNPEVMDYLASAVTSLAQAAAVLLNTPTPRRDGGDTVHPIPVDDG